MWTRVIGHFITVSRPPLEKGRPLAMESIELYPENDSWRSYCPGTSRRVAQRISEMVQTVMPVTTSARTLAKSCAGERPIVRHNTSVLIARAIHTARLKMSGYV